MKAPRRRIFWRVYLNGLLLIVLATLAVTATTILMQPESRFHGRPERLHQVLAAELARHIGSGRELQAALDRLAGAMSQSGAVYDRDGALLAASGALPPPALNGEDLPRIGGWHPIHLEGGGWVYAVALGEGSSPYLLIRAVESGWLSYLAVLAAILLVVALVSWPLARAWAGPLERLTATSRALAKGDLAARSGISRGDEVGQLAWALDDMARRLEERMRGERELFANISHEIRTPLARLRVALELLEDLPGDAQQALERLHGIGEDLTELELLVDNVLTSSRLDLAAGGPADLPLRPREVALGDFFARAAQRFAQHYPGQRLELDLAPGLPRAMVDRTLLNRACDNLLDNAVKYNQPGQPVRLAVRPVEGDFVVEVSDFGAGVAREDLPRLFDPFFRGPRCRGRQTGGAGLGLTLCKRIAETHGGAISARLNPQGPGMIFSLRLPL